MWTVILRERGMSKQHEMAGKIFPTNNGGDCIVVEYVNCNDITVKFLDKHEGVVKTRSENIRAGTVGNPNKNNLKGQVFSTKGGTDCIVLEYKGCRDVTVQFLDKNGYITKTHLKTLRSGGVKNPFDRTIYGIGYIGVGKHKPSLNGKDTKVYKLWASVICRTYHEYSLTKYPTYRDVEICDEWLSFQNFADWCLGNEFFNLGYCLDKDILSNGDKIYSAETCCFIPYEINTLFLDNSYNKGSLPTGATERDGRYRVRVSKGGSGKYIGTYDTPEEALKIYARFKESYVKDVARKWEGKIDDKVFQKLMVWKVK